MAGGAFVRRFSFDPGAQVLLNIESVNILDLNPPSDIQGVGTGVAILVGEFENAPYNAPFAVDGVTGTTGLLTLAGGLGYTYNGTPSQYPCAVSRKADSAISPEYWNGNGFVQLNGKQFGSLILCRVNTSVGAVSFTRLAAITGAASFSYGLSPSQVLALDLGIGAGSVSATFTATAATVLGTSAPGFVVTAGATLTLGYDGAPNFTVVFQAADSGTNAGIAARINAFAGFAFATSTSGPSLTLTGLQQGNGGQVRIISGSAGVLTALGLTAATTNGTGNVANIAAVTFNEVQTVVQAGITGTKVELDSQGRLRISNTATPGSGGSLTVGSATTATALGFTVGQQGTATGLATRCSTLVTNPSLFAGGETVTLGFDAAPNFTVTFTSGDSTPAQIASRINTAAIAAGFPVSGFTFADVPATNRLRLTGAKQGGQIRVVGASAGGILTTLGLTVGTQIGTAQVDGLLPAGTQVQVPGGNLYVVATDVPVTAVSVAGNSATGVGPYSVPIRFATDDGTGVADSASAITSVPQAPDVGAFNVLNPLPTTNALTEAQIDAAYVTALNATLGMSGICAKANMIWCARQSNAVRAALKNNAITASQSLFGRVAVGRTPMGTTEANALSSTAQPGVGAYRADRYIHCWPQVNSFVPAIAARGPAGGPAFNASGNVDIGADGFLVSIMSQLAPEENPGQETAFGAGASDLETAFQAGGSQYGSGGLGINDYIACKAAGVCAPRFDDGLLIFQSGVTSVDPSINVQLSYINRRRMADFLQDSIARFGAQFSKQRQTYKRRGALVSAIDQFLHGLLGTPGGSDQRIAGYGIKQVLNQQQLAAGRFRLRISVQLVPDFLSIEIETSVGTNVFDITEFAVAQAA